MRARIDKVFSFTYLGTKNILIVLSMLIFLQKFSCNLCLRTVDSVKACCHSLLVLGEKTSPMFAAKDSTTAALNTIYER